MIKTKCIMLEKDVFYCIGTELKIHKKHTEFIRMTVESQYDVHSYYLVSFRENKRCK